MNIWERAMRVFVKEQNGKSEKEIEKEVIEYITGEEYLKKKEEENKIPTIDVSIKGKYSLYTDYYEDKTTSMYQRDRSGWRVMLKVNAVAKLNLYGREREIKITDEVVEILGRSWYEETLCKNYMELDEEKKQERIKKGMEKMIVNKVCDQQLKDFKEEFNLANKKVEFDIKIEITQDNFYKE